MRAPPSKPNVFDFSDYRVFLQRWFAYRQHTRPKMSYRKFSRILDLGSPNYLKLVSDGKRNLSPAMAERFADVLELEGEGLRFFLKLVAFNQCTSRSERGLLRRELMGFAEFRRTHKLEASQFLYFSRWYVPAIRELVLRDDFVLDERWIASQLQPEIGVREVKEALDTLEALGLVRMEGERLVTSTPLVTSGREAPNDLLASYHVQMMKMGAESIDRFPSEERDISNLTLTLGPDGLQKMKRRIQEFRRELMELSTREEARTQVVQINFQLFPLSKDGQS